MCFPEEGVAVCAERNKISFPSESFLGLMGKDEPEQIHFVGSGASFDSLLLRFVLLVRSKC